MSGSHTAALPTAVPTARPPAWLVAATGLLALAILSMALAETNLWMHYLIDAGETVSLAGLVFMTLAGLYLYTRGRLFASLPLAVPWLLFPVITQGDQIIDNLSINWMRLVCHVLLAAIFGAPVSVLVMLARWAAAPGQDRTPRRIPGWIGVAVPGLKLMSEGRLREGSAVLAALLLTLEIWVAVQFLGTLMVITLILMIGGVLAHGLARPPGARAVPAVRSEKAALALLLAGLALSAGLFFGYKQRPGAYQGSPSSYMDPSQRDAGFRFTQNSVPTQAVAAPSNPDAVRSVLTGYGQAFQRLLAGYYILDRNYNYDFHNHLFLRSTPLLANYRMVGLQRVAEAQEVRAGADRAFAIARGTIPTGDPLAALLDDVRGYADFTFGRAPVLERMSAGFEQTQAGLQHATHIYEGEGKMLSVRLRELLDKHQRVLVAPAVAPVASEFAGLGKAVHHAYANRIVGF